MRLAPFIVAFVAISALASAGTQESPEVVDDPADAGPNGVPAPVGFGWGDIVAAWFEKETDTTFDLTIEVSDAMVPPKAAVIGLDFRVGAQTYAAGWGDFLFVSVPPFSGEGGFLCVTDAEGTPMNCTESQPATVSGTLYTVTGIPRAYVGALDAGAVISEPAGFSGHLAFAMDPTGTVNTGQYVAVDDTPAGKTFTFTKGVITKAEEKAIGTLNETGDPLANATAGEPLTQTQAPAQSTPGIESAFAIAGFAVVATVARRRR